MKTRLLVLCVVAIVAATQALAVTPGRDLFLVSVGHAQGACVGSPPVCPQWRTGMWISNPSSTDTAHVVMYFLERNKANTAPVQASITILPGETKEYQDAVLDPLGVSGKYGGIRVTSDIDVIVTGRIYDANVTTSKGVTGTTGQFFAGLPAAAAIGNTESTSIIGLEQDASGTTGIWRSNFGFQEVAGDSCTVQVQRIDANGNVLATKSYSVQARSQVQYAITDIGGTLSLNQRLKVSVTAGNGKVLAFASVIDNRTGDPSTQEMTIAPAAAGHTTGLFDGIVFSPDGSFIDGGLDITITSSGITDFTGTAGMPCGTASYVVDISATIPAPIALGADGSFTATVTIPYQDGSTTVFTTEWTLAGTLGTDGSIHGTLQSVTSGGISSGGTDYSTCNGTASRTMRAGWTQNS